MGWGEHLLSWDEWEREVCCGEGEAAAGIVHLVFVIFTSTPEPFVWLLISDGFVTPPPKRWDCG